MDNNISLTGDEARVLMVALSTSEYALPSNSVISLYLRLAQISQVQPPKTK